MIGQRLLAAFLTTLFFAFIIVGSVALARVLGHPGWGWVIGIGVCLMMVFGYLRQSKSEPPPPPPPPRRGRR